MSDKLNILITNDDGYEAEGIKVLAETLRETANVYVFAPDSNRSAVSSHIIMTDELTINKISDNEATCSGFPADCVITGLRSDVFCDVKFDAVLSGINQGSNMGTDCIYSGTVAAARQAVLYQVPGIALSLKAEKISTEKGIEYKFNYKGLALFVKRNLKNIIAMYEPGKIISINALSAEKTEDYKGVKRTSLCIRDYNDKVSLVKNSEGSYGRKFISGCIQTTGPEDNEYIAVKEGYIAVTQLYAEPVNFPVKDDQFHLSI